MGVNSSLLESSINSRAENSPSPFVFTGSYHVKMTADGGAWFMRNLDEVSCWAGRGMIRGLAAPICPLCLLGRTEAWCSDKPPQSLSSVTWEQNSDGLTYKRKTVKSEWCGTPFIGLVFYPFINVSRMDAREPRIALQRVTIAMSACL